MDKKRAPDKTDIEIIRILNENARATGSELSERVNLSVSAVIERIKKMEASGLIQGYSVIVSETAAGYDTKAIISIRLESAKYNESFCKRINKLSEVTACDYITGDFDYMLRVVCRSGDDLTRVLNLIKDIPGVSLTRTYVVLEQVKHTVSVVPDHA